jgi:hypothetical protein
LATLQKSLSFHISLQVFMTVISQRVVLYSEVGSMFALIHWATRWHISTDSNLNLLYINILIIHTLSLPLLITGHPKLFLIHSCASLPSIHLYLYL